MITRSEAIVELRRMLSDAGINAAAPRSLGEVWDVFKEFARIPSDAIGPDADGILYQSGVFNFHGRDEFYLDFLRQFEFADARGEHDHFEQLHCEFRFAVTPETRAFDPFERWWFADSGDSWIDFVREVERRPEFLALANVSPAAVAIEQERV